MRDNSAGDLRTHEFDSLRTALSGKVADAQTSEDAEKYASALKSVSDAAGAAGLLDVQRRNTSAERLKSWGQILVPIVAVLSVSATAWNQTAQMQQTRANAEDVQWTALVTDLAATDRHPEAVRALAQRLKPFLRNERYANDARDVSVLLLGKIIEPATFKDLLGSTFPTPNGSDIPRIARINRDLNRIWDSNKSRLDKWKAVSLGQEQGSPASPGIVEATEELQSLTSKEIVTVSDLVADLLRKRKSTDALDLSGMWFPQTDLHDANLRNTDLSDDSFSDANLTGADLRGTAVTNGLNDSRWWLANALDKDSIESLIKANYPYQFNESGEGPEMRYSGDTVSKQEYEMNVARLCEQAGCKIAANLPFGPIIRKPSVINK